MSADPATWGPAVDEIRATLVGFFPFVHPWPPSQDTLWVSSETPDVVVRVIGTVNAEIIVTVVHPDGRVGAFRSGEVRLIGPQRGSIWLLVEWQPERGVIEVLLNGDRLPPASAALPPSHVVLDGSKVELSAATSIRAPNAGAACAAAVGERRKRRQKRISKPGVVLTLEEEVHALKEALLALSADFHAFNGGEMGRMRSIRATLRELLVCTRSRGVRPLGADLRSLGAAMAARSV